MQDMIVVLPPPLFHWVKFLSPLPSEAYGLDILYFNMTTEVGQVRSCAQRRIVHPP